ncbi:MAG: hypothetical protein V3R99_06745 [Thermoguttaceae bacterium]
MIQTILHCKRCLAAGPILLLVSVFGCGTREYEQRLGGAVQQLKQESVFADMKPSAALSGATVKIPNSFQSEPLTEATQIAGAPIDPRRVKPPNINIPGLQVTYEESLVDGAGGKRSYYCYLATIDTTTQGNADPLDLMRRQAQTAFPRTTGTVEPVQCATPQGNTNEWKRLRSTGDQEFYYVDRNNNADFRTMPGAMEFYSRQEGNTIILIGWRIPTDGSGKGLVDIETWAKLVAGSATAP